MRDKKQRRYPGLERVTYTDRFGKKALTKTWYIRYRWKGRQIRESTGLTDEKAAFELLCQRKDEMRTGRLMRENPERIRIEVLERLVIDDYTNRGFKTSLAVKRRYQYLAQWFGDAKMLHVTPADLNAYARARREGGPFRVVSGPRKGQAAKNASAGTVSVELANLHRGFTLAVQSKLLPECPRFPKIDAHNARKVFIQRGTLTTLLEGLPEYLRPIPEVGLLTGWRKEAILAREWKHVDLNARTLTLDSQWSKNRQPVVIPLRGRLLEVLTAQHERARQLERARRIKIPWVFFYPDDGQNVVAGARVKDFDARWQAACAAAGLDVHFHDLRRGAIRSLRRAGASEHEIMEWVGLKTRAVFDRYDVVDDERMQDTARRQEEYDRQEMERVRPFRTS